MGRQPRYEAKNAYYHVINRGAARKHIFVNDNLKLLFLSILEEASEKYNFVVNCFCIMGNHYHLILQTKEPNLSSAMKYLNSRYAMRYNKLRLKDGPIFKDRFKSIFISSERYLFALTRYIHLNPVKARLVEKPEDYLWSSYRAYLGLDRVGKSVPLLRTTSSTKYKHYVDEGNSQFIEDFYAKQYLKNIM